MKCWLDRYPRLNELHERIGPSKAYNVLASYIRLGESEPLAHRDAEWLEANLARLDPKAWRDLIEKVLPCSCSKQESRGWQQFWDLLNESRGYVLLKDRGYSEITFVEPEVLKKGQPSKHAEFIGESSSSRAIIEVKTINRSEDDLERSKRRNDPTFLVGKRGRPGDIKDLPAFANKLMSKSDTVSTFLWNQLDRPAQEAVVHLVSGSLDSKQMESVLIESLNRIIKGPCICDKMRFKGVPLQDFTVDLMEGSIECPGFIFSANRCLLDDAYREQLSSWYSTVAQVEVLSPDMPVPVKLKKKCEERIGVARNQIEATLRRRAKREEPPVDRKIVLLIINRDFGCSSIGLKKLQEMLFQSDLEVVCEIGDF
jgi:hypothetical protein